MRTLRTAVLFLCAMLAGALLHAASVAPHGQPATYPYAALASDVYVGGGSPFQPATSYSSLTDPGAGIGLTTSGQISLADPVAALVVTTLTPTTIAGAANFSGTPTFSAANLFTLNGGGTACTSSVQCTATVSGTNNGTVTLQANTAASTDGIVLSQTNSGNGTCTAASAIVNVKKDSSSQDVFTCGGDFKNVGGNSFMNSSSAGFGEYYTGGASKTSSSYESAGSGTVAIGVEGTLIQDVRCTQSGSAANPTVVTLSSATGDMVCEITPGDAGSATSVTINFAHSFKTGDTPACLLQFEVLAAGTTPICTTTVSAATVSFTGGGGIPIADKFWIHIIGNGP